MAPAGRRQQGAAADARGGRQQEEEEEGRPGDDVLQVNAWAWVDALGARWRRWRKALFALVCGCTGEPAPGDAKVCVCMCADICPGVSSVPAAAVQRPPQLSDSQGEPCTQASDIPSAAPPSTCHHLPLPFGASTAARLAASLWPDVGGQRGRGEHSLSAILAHSAPPIMTTCVPAAAACCPSLLCVCVLSAGCELSGAARRVCDERQRLWQCVCLERTHWRAAGTAQGEAATAAGCSGWHQ